MKVTNRYGTMRDVHFGQHFVTAFVYLLAVGMLLAYVFGLGGCAAPGNDEPYVLSVPVSQPKPGQIETVRIIWNDTYGMTTPAPAISWVEGDDLDCNEGMSFVLTENGNSFCIFGVTGVDPSGAIVLRVAYDNASNRKPGNTSLAHELCHAMYYTVDGDLDSDHSGTCYNRDGLGGQAVAALKAAGLY